MGLEWEQVVVHAVDPARLGQWWSAALGWPVTYSTEDEFELRPAPDRLPALDFVRVGEGGKTESRLHLDFRPDDQEAEVARLEALGARLVHGAHGGRSWVVLADPEGNEFCVLGPRHP
jgi:predicted enzyme related to lactoylglutathione lyase